MNVSLPVLQYIVQAEEQIIALQTENQQLKSRVGELEMHLQMQQGTINYIMNEKHVEVQRRAHAESQLQLALDSTRQQRQVEDNLRWGHGFNVFPQRLHAPPAMNAGVEEQNGQWENGDDSAADREEQATASKISSERNGQEEENENNALGA